MCIIKMNTSKSKIITNRARYLFIARLNAFCICKTLIYGMITVKSTNPFEIHKEQ